MSEEEIEREDIDDPRYEELRRLARRLLGNVRRPGDPEPTELVHECFLRLARQPRWKSLSEAERRAYAARSLRNTLIDMRRAEASDKRGGHRARLTLDDRFEETEGADALDLLALSEGMEALAESHKRQADVVALRYFGGLSNEEAGMLLGVPARTISNDWAFAGAWLHRFLSA
ncbi:MAG: ECF-type sigma factor [Planctomycetota bacterium]